MLLGQWSVWGVEMQYYSTFLKLDLQIEGHPESKAFGDTKQ